MSRSLFQSTAVTGGAEGDVVTIIVGTPTGAGPESADWSYQTADIETVAGAAIGGGQVKLKAGGVTPRFYGPDGVTTLKVLRNRAVAATLTGIADPLATGTSLALPSQTGNSGKVLSTDGTNPLWAAAGSSLAPTATKIAAYTASVGDLAMMNVTGGGTTLTLPAAPADKAQVGYRAIGATAATPLAVNRGGSDTIGIAGATSVSIPLADEITVLQYDAANTRWLTVANVKTQASLDDRYAARKTAAKIVRSYTRYYRATGSANVVARVRQVEPDRVRLIIRNESPTISIQYGPGAQDNSGFNTPTMTLTIPPGSEAEIAGTASAFLSFTPTGGPARIGVYAEMAVI